MEHLARNHGARAVSRIGIQLKADHPALLKPSNGYEPARPRTEPDFTLVLQAFASAYGFSIDHAFELWELGSIQLERTDDGSLWVCFVSDLTPEEAAQALRAMGRMKL